MLSQFASFLGDEQTAIGLFEQPSSGSVIQPDLSSATSREAFSAIVEAAQGTQIVILKGAHNILGHRAFVGQVARALRPLGYDWFAAETFLPTQGEPAPSISFYRHGMPFIPGFGYYTLDPDRSASRSGEQTRRLDRPLPSAAGVQNGCPLPAPGFERERRDR